MDSKSKIEALAGVFQALSDPNRLRMLELLRKRAHPLCVNALAREIGISQSAVSQHLKILRQHELVTVKKEGYYKHYSLARDWKTIRNLRESVLGTDFEI